MNPHHAGGHAHSQGLMPNGQLSGLDGRLDANLSQDSKTKMFVYRKSQESNKFNVCIMLQSGATLLR